MGEVLKELGVGLSRLLRYSYGGFLLIAFASFLQTDAVKAAREAMSWEVTALVALVMGSGIYALHRNVVVPLHHGLLCICWAIVDWARGVKKTDSSSPTRWLSSLEVPLAWRIAAYTAVRRSDLFEKEKSEWDVSHAEAGLVLMTAEAFAFATAYVVSLPSPPVAWQTLALVALGLFIFSYAVFPQHALECLRFRGKREEIRQLLEGLGMISREAV